MHTILIVDDEKFLCLSLSRLLQKHGYTTICASSGPEAIALASQDPTRFALALVDLHMPELSGEDTARQLKQLIPTLKIAMMTGHSPNFSPDAHPATQTLAVGETLLFKPFEQGAVIETVKRLMA